MSQGEIFRQILLQIIVCELHMCMIRGEFNALTDSGHTKSIDKINPLYRAAYYYCSIIFSFQCFMP